jgi:hypothetical protein
MVFQMSLESGLMHSFLGMHRIGAPREVDQARLCGEIPHKCSPDSSTPRPRDVNHRHSFGLAVRKTCLESHLQSCTVNIGVMWVCFRVEYTMENLAEAKAAWSHPQLDQMAPPSPRQSKHNIESRISVYLRAVKCGGGGGFRRLDKELLRVAVTAEV